MYDVRPDKMEFDEARGSSRRATGSFLPVAMVLGFCVLVIVVLVGFTGVAGLYIVLALAGVVGFAGLHYVLWGWWLTNKLRADEKADAGNKD